MGTLTREDVERLYEPYWADGREPYFECNNGWLGILAKLARKFKYADEPVQVYQIKEKFGTLTIYTDSYTPQMQEWLTAATKASESTCENCGNPGALGVRNYWWSVRCDTCKPEGWVVATDDEDEEAV